MNEEEIIELKKLQAEKAKATEYEIKRQKAEGIENPYINTTDERFNLSKEDAMKLENHLNSKLPPELLVPVSDLNIEGLNPYGRFGVCSCCNKANKSRLLICDSCTKHVGFECECYKHHGKVNCTYNHPTTDVETPK